MHQCRAHRPLRLLQRSDGGTGTFLNAYLATKSTRLFDKHSTEQPAVLQAVAAGAAGVTERQQLRAGCVSGETLHRWQHQRSFDCHPCMKVAQSSELAASCRHAAHHSFSDLVMLLRQRPCSFWRAGSAEAAPGRHILPDHAGKGSCIPADHASTMIHFLAALRLWVSGLLLPV